MAVDWGARWSEVRKLLERPGPFTHPDFEPSPDTLKMMQDNIKVLIIGEEQFFLSQLCNILLLLCVDILKQRFKLFIGVGGSMCPHSSRYCSREMKVVH